MYNLLLVDDEKIALDGLSHYVQWEDMGFHLKGAVTSIAEAKNIIEYENIHVVLTDIELERESGLDLIQWVHLNYPTIVCVVLTGHRSFDYAQKALRYNVFDFLIKPIQFDTLRITFSRLKSKLEASETINRKNDEFLQLKKVSFFNKMVSDQNFIPDPVLLAQMEIAPYSTLLLARISLSDKTVSPECTRSYLFDNLIKQYTWTHQPDIFYMGPLEFSVIFYDVSESTLSEQLTHWLNSNDVILKIAISGEFHHLKNLYHAHRQAGQALDYAFWKHSESVICFRNMELPQEERCTFSEELKASFMAALESKNLNTMIALVDNELLSLCRSSNNINLLHSFGIELFMFISHFLKNYLPGYAENENMQMVRQIISLASPDDICVYIRKCVFSMWSLVKDSSTHSSNTLLEIQKYINEHYMDNISLHHLAEVFFLHPNYLSRMFKEKIGQNFIDYLTSVRVEKAKDLLKTTNWKIGEISLAVGYETPKYFSNIFKEKCGMTPKEYRISDVK